MTEATVLAVINTRERARREIAAAGRCRPNRRVLAPDRDWMDSAEVSEALKTTLSTLRTARVPHISASINGKSGSQGCGALYRREVIQRIANIRRECKVSFAAAVRIEAAQREARI